MSIIPPRKFEPLYPCFFIIWNINKQFIWRF